MKKTVVIILLCMPFLSFSQGNGTLYNEKINLAELQVTEKNYENALTIYQEAFKEKEFPFAVDYYNALLCAVFSKKEEIAFQFLYKLANKGIEFSYFDNNKYLKELKNNENWNKFMLYCSENKDLINSKFDAELNTIFKEMVDKEQLLIREKKMAEYKIQVKMNTELFIKSIKAKGFPTEEMLGVRLPNGANYFPTTVLIHYIKLYSDSLEIISLLKENYQLSNLSASSFFNIVSFSFDDTFKAKTCYVVDSVIVDMKITEERLLKINKIRKENGFPSFEDTYKKAKFYIQNTLNWTSIRENETFGEHNERLLQARDLEYFNIGASNFVQIFSTSEENRNELIKSLGGK